MNGLVIRRTGQTITFEVRVAPRASRDRVIGVHDGVLKVALTAPPVDGAANEALKKLLAKKLGVSKSDVQILRGDRARAKLISVRGIDERDVSFEDA